MTPATVDRQPMWVKCSPCGHVWIALHVPIPVSTFCAVMKTLRCPMCASTSKEHVCYEAGRTPAGAVVEVYS